MLKCQFHCHCEGDPVDSIRYSPKKLIDEAARLKYDVLSITCHRKIIFNKNLQRYAKKRGILLIPGIEFEIGEKHILGINIDSEIQNIDSFEKLKTYKKTHPECLIIAPHPFFPGKNCLHRDLINNIQLFDAIEISWAYTKEKNYNHEAIKLSERWKKPLLATADCHILSYLNIGYTSIKSQKDIKSIFKAIKENKITNSTKPTSYYKIARFFAQIGWQNFMKKISSRDHKKILTPAINLSQPSKTPSNLV